MRKYEPNLSSIYISPLELCNLNCKICYTCKTKGQLTQEQVLDFVNRYCQQQKLEVVTFCGGEVFLLNWFCECINHLTDLGLVIEIITNGTIDKLDEIKDPNKVNLIVSLDGLESDHDLNRGRGNFVQSIHFIKKAVRLGFHLEIFTVVSAINYESLDDFEYWLKAELGFLPEITYHPRKPLQYLTNHPVSNRIGEREVFGFLSNEQIQKLSKKNKVFPPKNLGCHQLSIMSDGQVYGCCEGTKPIGKISDNINSLVEKYQQQVEISPRCIEPEFMCGLCDICKENIR